MYSAGEEVAFAEGQAFLVSELCCAAERLA